MAQNITWNDFKKTIDSIFQLEKSKKYICGSFEISFITEDRCIINNCKFPDNFFIGNISIKENYYHIKVGNPIPDVLNFEEYILISINDFDPLEFTISNGKPFYVHTAFNNIIQKILKENELE